MDQVNIALHLFAAIIMLILLIAAISERKIDSHVPRPLLLMMIMNILQLTGSSAFVALRQHQVEAEILLPVLQCLIQFLFYGIFFEFLFYLKEYFSPAKRLDTIILSVTGATLLICALLRALTILQPDFSKQAGFILRFGGICIFLVIVWMLLRCRPRMTRADQMVMLTTMIMPLLGMLIRNAFPRLQLFSLSVTLSLLLIYGFVHLNLAYRAKAQQLELAKSSMTIMLSQIRPHFLYNALNSIYVLCGKDPAKAQEAIADFSEYLRANMGNTAKTLITIDQELDHVRHYLALEKIRFEDQLRVVIHHQSHGFLVPPLSVQPLCENAVKHGIHKKEGGGTVTIHTHEDEKYYYVDVSDDGVGFDPEKVMDSDQNHIGIANVKSRLKNACEGTLEIEISADKGTRVRIRIPKIHSGLEAGTK